jgi:hypothetical protein
LPTEVRSIFFFKSKLCVACKNGFQVVDLNTFNTRELLRCPIPEKDLTPVAIFRINDDGEYLLCFDKMGFFINKKGYQTRKDVVISWVGLPFRFEVKMPHLIAFDSSLIEIYNLNNGQLAQIIPVSNPRVLFDNSNLVFAMNSEETANQEIAVLQLI